MNFTGDLYAAKELRSREVASFLKSELPAMVKPHRVFVSHESHTCSSSINITIKGRALLDDSFKLTDEARRIKETVEAHANRYNFDQSWENGDYTHKNFYLHVEIENLYTPQEVRQEAARLQEVYTITDEATRQETWSSIDHSPLIALALEFLRNKFKSKKATPSPNYKVTEEMDRWIQKVKEWYGHPVMYETGPKYYRVFDAWRGGDGNVTAGTLCMVDRQDGTIYKTQYRSVIKSSARGTIFDGVPVFDEHGLIDKIVYLVREAKHADAEGED